MNKSNIHKKDYGIDEFSRRFCCPNHRLRKLREDKRLAKKKTRNKNKRVERQEKAEE